MSDCMSWVVGEAYTDPSSVFNEQVIPINSVEDGIEVAIIRGSLDPDHDNAHLIAAAPELLEVLERVIRGH